MIILILKCYLTLFLYIGIGSVCFFLAGAYFIVRPAFRLLKKSERNEVQAVDVAAIAGDDVMATQLDLARAYIEAGKEDSAKKMLIYITAQGSAIEKKEAQRLLGLI